MSLSQTIADGVEAAFAAVGDLAITHTIRRSTGGGGYDPATGTYSSGSIEDVIRTVEGAFEATELQSVSYQVGDIKLYTPAIDLTNLVAPADNDIVLMGSDEWTLIRFDSVPGKSLYGLHIRKAS